MTGLRMLFSKFAGLFRKARLEQQLDDDVRAHIEMLTEENLRKGMGPEEARYAAQRQFGNVSSMKAECRERWSIRFIEELVQDIRYGLRQLRRNPGFTIVAVLTLALGIGATTAIFSVVNGVLLRQLPYPQPDRLVALYSRTVQFQYWSISYPNFLDWVHDNRSFSGLAGYRPDSFNLTGMGKPERLPVEMVSASFFPLLGVKPAIGRTFSPQEDKLGGAPVALISGGFWKRKFGASRNVLGKAITLNRVAYTIIGVVPSNFYYIAHNFQRGDIYVPIGQWDNPRFRNRGAAMGLNALGRLKPGVTLQQARSDMDAVAQQLSNKYPKINSHTGITLVPLKQNATGSVQPYLLLLVIAVGLVLLIACVNVANLMLARSTARADEFAVRVALGANRGRVIRQLLIESILLAFASGGLGLLLATWGLQSALRMAPGELMTHQTVRLDGNVLLFTLTASLLAGVLFGLAPALKASLANLQERLNQGGRASVAAHHSSERALVVLEVALALVLMAGAGLTIRSLAKLWSVDPGFKPHQVLTFHVSFPPANSPDAMRGALRDFHDKVAALPAVEALSLSGGAFPMLGDSEIPFWLEGEPKPQSKSQMKATLLYLVEPDYLKVMKIPLLRGRFLTIEDHEHKPLSVVIDRRFAQLYFPDKNPTGKRINFDIPNTSAEIVGVVGHVKQWGLEEGAAPPVEAQCYLSVYQLPSKFLSVLASDVAVVVHTTGTQISQLGPISNVLNNLNDQAVMFDTATMDGIISHSLAARRFSTILMSILAGLALVMGTVGIYGVISYLVSQRTHEIGIRMALGAEKRDVLRMVIGQGLKLALIGVAIGVAGALALTRFLSSLLYGVKPADPLTFIAVSVILIAVALVACYIPACRASKIDPMVALRYE